MTNQFLLEKLVDLVFYYFLSLYTGRYNASDIHAKEHHVLFLFYFLFCIMGKLSNVIFCLDLGINNGTSTHFKV